MRSTDDRTPSGPSSSFARMSKCPRPAMPAPQNASVPALNSGDRMTSMNISFPDRSIDPEGGIGGASGAARSAEASVIEEMIIDQSTNLLFMTALQFFLTECLEASRKGIVNDAAQWEN